MDQNCRTDGRKYFSQENGKSSIEFSLEKISKSMYIINVNLKLKISA